MDFTSLFPAVTLFSGKKVCELSIFSLRKLSDHFYSPPTQVGKKEQNRAFFFFPPNLGMDKTGEGKAVGDMCLQAALKHCAKKRREEEKGKWSGNVGGGEARRDLWPSTYPVFPSKKTEKKVFSSFIPIRCGSVVVNKRLRLGRKELAIFVRNQNVQQVCVSFLPPHISRPPPHLDTYTVYSECT